MPLTDFLAGLLLFAVGVAAPTFAADRVVRRRLTWMAVEARVVAWGVLALAAIALSTLIPLALGILSRGTVLATALLLGVLSLRIRPLAAAPESVPRERTSLAARVGAGALVLAAVSVFVALLRVTAPTPIGDIDSTGFILPTLQGWITTGTLWSGQDFIAGWGFGAYPNTGGLIQLAAVVPWHADFALRAVNLAVVALGAAAVYALSVELGAARPFAAGAAALSSVVPAGVVTALNAQTDALAATGLACGALFLVRNARSDRAGDLWLAAVALGLAFGAKWYGPPQVAVMLAIWCVALLLARRSHALRRPLLVGAGAGAIGGIWLVRNLVEFGSPVFPAKAVVFGGPERTAASDIDFSLLHYVDRPGIIADVVLPQFGDAFALAGALLLVGAIAAAAVALRVRDGRALALAVACGAAAVTYTAMPFTALGLDGEPTLALAAMRYATPVFLLAAACSAWFVSRAPKPVQVLAGVLAGAGLLHAVSLFYEHSGRALSLPAASFAKALLATLGLAAVVFAARRRRALQALMLTAAAAITVVAARDAQQDQLGARFAADPASAFILERAPRGVAIGLAGVMTGRQSLNTVVFGPRIGNDVRFIGPRVDGLQVRDGDAVSFVRRLEAAGVDYLVVGEELDSTAAPELRWSKDAGWRPVASSERYTILSPD